MFLYLLLLTFQTVPLPQMKEWRRADGKDAAYVCPSRSGDGAITREAVEKFYRRTLALSGKHSPHSWRTVLSTWANDAQTGTKPRERITAIAPNCGSSLKNFSP